MILFKKQDLEATQEPHPEYAMLKPREFSMRPEHSLVRDLELAETTST
jgi:hypothetical protein